MNTTRCLFITLKCYNTSLYRAVALRPIVKTMGRLLVLVPDALERKFRFAIVAMKGGKKGGLSAAVVESIEDWLKKHERAIAAAA